MAECCYVICIFYLCLLTCDQHIGDWFFNDISQNPTRNPFLLLLGTSSISTSRHRI